MSIQLGINHFLEMISSYHPKWIVVAVKADVDRVSDSLTEIAKVKSIRRNVTISEIEYEQTSSSDMIAIAQPKNNSWSVISWGLNSWAELLSKRLHTKAVTLAMDDTSAGTTYEIYHNGKLVEKADWAPGFNMHYESNIRPQPNLDLLDPDDDDETYDEEKGTTHNEQVFHKFVDRVFCEEGVYIPTCWPQSNGEDGQLFVEAWSIGLIERANLLDIAA